MEKRRLIINLIANIISYTSTILISFILTPYLIRVLGKEVYGFYPLANNFINYMSIITVALNSMAARFITIEIVKNNYKKANKYFSSIFFANIILSLILGMLMLIIVVFLPRILNIPLNLVDTIKILFSLVFLSMIINIITSIFGVATFAKDRIDLRSISEIIKGVLRIILYILLFNIFKPNIIYIGLIAVILESVIFLVNYKFTKILLPKIKIDIGKFDIKVIKQVIASGVWNSVNQLGGSLLYGMDLIIGNIFLGEIASGEISIVQTVPNFINGIISMLTGVFMPRIMRKYAENNINGLIKEVKMSQKIMGLIVNVPICIFIVFGKEFFDLWVPGNNSYILQKLSILTIMHLILVGVVWPISNLNIVMNRVKKPSLLMILNGVINITSMIFLINNSQLGILAIPLTTMFISFIWFGIFIPIYPCKSLSIRKTTFYPVIIRTIISVPIIILMASSIKKIFIVDSWIKLFIIGGLCGGIGLVINAVFILGIKECVDVILLIKNKYLNKYNL